MAQPYKTSCIFFSRGACKYGDSCQFVHERGTSTHGRSRPVVPVHQPFKISEINSNVAFMRDVQGRKSDVLTQRLPESRNTVPCKFFLQPGGCQKDSCPFLHVTPGPQSISTNSQGLESNQDDEEFENLTALFSGASVQFDEFGHVLKISLPTDYSVACITGLTPDATSKAIVDALREVGFDLDISQVRIASQGVLSETRATVKMEDPLFAKQLSSALRENRHRLSATSVPIATDGTDSRKVYISWHKAVCNVWLNFGNGEIANRVAQKFNEGTYTCLGHRVKSSTAKYSSRYGRYSNSDVPWTITLSNVPKNTTVANIKTAISAYDKPRHIELGQPNYKANDAEVSLKVRSRLEEYGPLENFQMVCPPTGKRVKATAWFLEEADAIAARHLHDERLEFLGQGKLTVAQVSSAKVKVPTAVYAASKIRIEKEQERWKERNLILRVYPDTENRFTLLKFESANAKDVASARSKLNQILSGEIMTDGGRVLWSPAFCVNGNASRDLKSIETELNVVIIRSKMKRQLRFHGSSEKLQQAVSRIVSLLKQETTSHHNIDLQPHHFAWAVQGGFKKIENALGSNTAVFDVVSKRIIIVGTNEHRTLALSIMQEENVPEPQSSLSKTSKPDEDCPICFCEAENAIKTTCKHTYCLECLEEYCKSVASNMQQEFRAKCQGDEGNCPVNFTLRELKVHISSSAFDEMLKLSFEAYTQRRPESFRCCPTPECGFLYRCATTPGVESPKYVCPNCFEPLCTACHAQHVGHTCAEYKDIKSGGVEALEKLKKELNIKDCPKCTTPMEKTYGCNHMTCLGCKAHICWFCMDVFTSSSLCYDHMSTKHGG